MEAARGDELRLLVERQWQSAIDVSGDLLQNDRIPRVVLQELTRQLNGIPRNAVDTREAGLRHAREQVMQTVPKLVEHCHDVIVGKQGRPILIAGR